MYLTLLISPPVASFAQVALSPPRLSRLFAPSPQSPHRLRRPFSPQSPQSPSTASPQYTPDTPELQTQPCNTASIAI